MREYNMSQLHGKMAHGQLNPTGTHFMTGNAGFSRSFYNEVGGFDPRLRLNEDSELGYRFERHGAEFVFCDEASAVHHSNIGTYDKWILRQYDYGKYAVYVWEKFDRNINLHPLIKR